MAQHFTHDNTEPVAVFLIGMRFNTLAAVRHWLPVFLAMPKMLAELSKDEAGGLLEARTVIGWRGPMVIQYWRSVEDIYAYANDRDREHRPAWKAFYQRARKHPGAVGIWHETYAVPAGASESIYYATPPMGLAAATGTRPVAGRNATARQRMGSVA